MSVQVVPRLLQFGLMFLVLACASTADGRQPQSRQGLDLRPLEHLDSRGVPNFLPEKYLQSAPLETLNIHPIPLGKLRFRIDEQKNRDEVARFYPGGRVPVCWPSENSQFVTTSSEAPMVSRLFDNLAKSDAIFTGKIHELIPGWDLERFRVRRVAVLELTEVFQGDLGLAVGATLLVPIDGGKIKVEGVEICDEPDPFRTEPIIDQELLIAANSQDGDGRYSIVYQAPVSGGVIRPFVTDPDINTTLENLKRHLERVAQ